jgi:hypothetical protein
LLTGANLLSASCRFIGVFSFSIWPRSSFILLRLNIGRRSKGGCGE